PAPRTPTSNRHATATQHAAVAVLQSLPFRSRFAGITRCPPDHVATNVPDRERFRQWGRADSVKKASAKGWLRGWRRVKRPHSRLSRSARPPLLRRDAVQPRATAEKKNRGMRDLCG